MIDKLNPAPSKDLVNSHSASRVLSDAAFISGGAKFEGEQLYLTQEQIQFLAKNALNSEVSKAHTNLESTVLGERISKETSEKDDSVLVLHSALQSELGKTNGELLKEAQNLSALRDSIHETILPYSGIFDRDDFKESKFSTRKPTFKTTRKVGIREVDYTIVLDDASSGKDQDKRVIMKTAFKDPNINESETVFDFSHGTISRIQVKNVEKLLVGQQVPSPVVTYRGGDNNLVINLGSSPRLLIEPVDEWGLHKKISKSKIKPAHTYEYSASQNVFVLTSQSPDAERQAPTITVEEFVAIIRIILAHVPTVKRAY